jgi:hypothetical protein
MPDTTSSCNAVKRPNDLLPELTSSILIRVVAKFERSVASTSIPRCSNIRSSDPRLSVNGIRRGAYRVRSSLFGKPPPACAVLTAASIISFASMSPQATLTSSATIIALSLDTLSSKSLHALLRSFHLLIQFPSSKAAPPKERTHQGRKGLRRLHILPVHEKGTNQQ